MCTKIVFFLGLDQYTPVVRQPGVKAKARRLQMDGSFGDLGGMSRGRVKDRSVHFEEGKSI